MHFGFGVAILSVLACLFASAPAASAIHTYRPPLVRTRQSEAQQQEQKPALQTAAPLTAFNDTAALSNITTFETLDVIRQPAPKPAAPELPTGVAPKPLPAIPTRPTPVSTTSASNHSRGSSHHSFTYWGSNGPRNWPKLFNNSCAGSSQSPIALEYVNATYQQFAAGNFMPESVELGEVELENDGLKLHISFSESFFLSGLGLRGVYQVDHVHLHWGAHALIGSEHSLDGRFYPLEIHIVTHSARFANVKAAVASGERDALAVLGVFGTVGKPSSDTREWTDGLSLVQHPGCSASVEAGVTPWSFLPAEDCERARFYRYEGSLTTPNCSQVVLWTVFADPLAFSEQQLNALRSMTAEQPKEYSTNQKRVATGTAAAADVCAGPAMTNNFRPLQARGDRPVYRSFDLHTRGCAEDREDNEDREHEKDGDDDEDRNGKENEDDDE